MFMRKAAAVIFKPEILPPTEHTLSCLSPKLGLDWMLLQSMSLDPSGAGIYQL